MFCVDIWIWNAVHLSASAWNVKEIDNNTNIYVLKLLFNLIRSLVN